MKRILATALLLCSFVFIAAPMALAEEDQETKIEDTESFNVLDILSIGDEEDEQTEHLTEELIEEATTRTEEGVETSPAAALIIRAINILMLLIGTFGFVLLIIGGFVWSTAAGNETQIDRGKSIITQTVIGIFVAFFSYFIVTFILSFFYA